MLKLNLSPTEDTQGQGPTIVKWSAPILTVDGTNYDLSELPDGATAEHPVLSTAARNGDDYTVSITLRYRHGAPEATTFPEPITVTKNGPITLPPYDAEEEPAQ